MPPPPPINQPNASMSAATADAEEQPFLHETASSSHSNNVKGGGKPHSLAAALTSTSMMPQTMNNGAPILKSIVKPHLIQQQQQQQTKKVLRSLLGLLIGVFLLTVLLIVTSAKTSEDDGSCPGNLVLSDCLCYKRCDTGDDGLAIKACSSDECETGCGCPADQPFLIDANTCAASCPSVLRPSMMFDENPNLERIAKDFTDCPMKEPYKKLGADESLYAQTGAEIFHVRISPTYPCDRTSPDIVDVLLHFTAFVKSATCKKSPPNYFVSYKSNAKTRLLAPAGQIACLDTHTDEYDVSIRGAWFFYVARLSKVASDCDVEYSIGTKQATSKQSILRSFVSPLAPGQNNPDRPVLVLGDTATSGARVVASAAAKFANSSGYSLTIHVGDGSYATNRGDCYDYKGDDPKNRCGYDCTGLACHGADKVQSQEMLSLYTWAKVIDEDLGGKTAWVTTMGNHDNDIPWFLTYRPPVVAAAPGVLDKSEGIQLSWAPNDYGKFKDAGRSNAQKQVDAMEIMKLPHFYSFDNGLMHVIEIGTEDNPINAYETWNGKPLSPELMERWEHHYGKNSLQYRWLEHDLQRANANRKKVPWIIIYTHRPMYHTAQHHAWCSAGGDWYACLFVETYEPLLRKYGVNIFLTGHSHHYQRSLPMSSGEVSETGTIHLIVGVGGYEVVGEKWVQSPKWIASRQGTTLGYARFWIKNATSIYWEHVAAETEKVLDSVWFTNAFLEQ